VAALIKVFSECVIIGTVRTVGIDWVAELKFKSIDAAKLLFEARTPAAEFFSDVLRRRGPQPLAAKAHNHQLLSFVLVIDLYPWG
jgi:hypothetical protein